jgi:hypothetical protein
LIEKMSTTEAIEKFDKQEVEMKCLLPYGSLK